MEFARAIGDYIVWHEVNRHSPKTILWYRWNLGAFERWLHATNRPTRIAEITVADAWAFLQSGWAHVPQLVVMPSSSSSFRAIGVVPQTHWHSHSSRR